MRLIKKTAAAIALAITGFVGGSIGGAAAFGLPGILGNEEKVMVLGGAEERLRSAQTLEEMRTVTQEPAVAEVLDSAKKAGGVGLALAFLGAVAGGTLVGRRKEVPAAKPNVPKL